MCNYSGKLIAWLDGELEIDEMADVQRHVGECIECRKHFATYKQVSATFDAYCDAVVAAKIRRSGLPRWVPAVSAVGAAAIAAVLALALMRVRVEPPLLPLSVKAPTPPAIVLETTHAPVKAIHRRHMPPHRCRRNGELAANAARYTDLHPCGIHVSSWSCSRRYQLHCGAEHCQRMDLLNKFVCGRD